MECNLFDKLFKLMKRFFCNYICTYIQRCFVFVFVFVFAFQFHFEMVAVTVGRRRHWILSGFILLKRSDVELTSWKCNTSGRPCGDAKFTELLSYIFYLGKSPCHPFVMHAATCRRCFIKYF